MRPPPPLPRALGVLVLGTPLYSQITTANMYLLIKIRYTGELGYDEPLYDGFLHVTDDMLGPSPMHIKYSSYVND